MLEVRSLPLLYMLMPTPCAFAACYCGADASLTECFLCMPMPMPFGLHVLRIMIVNRISMFRLPHIFHCSAAVCYSAQQLYATLLRCCWASTCPQHIRELHISMLSCAASVAPPWCRTFVRRTRCRRSCLADAAACCTPHAGLYVLLLRDTTSG